MNQIQSDVKVTTKSKGSIGDGPQNQPISHSGAMPQTENTVKLKRKEVKGKISTCVTCKCSFEKRNVCRM